MRGILDVAVNRDTMNADIEFLIAYAKERHEEGATLYEMVKELQALHPSHVPPSAGIRILKLAGIYQPKPKPGA